MRRMKSDYGAIQVLNVNCGGINNWKQLLYKTTHQEHEILLREEARNLHKRLHDVFPAATPPVLPDRDLGIDTEQCVEIFNGRNWSAVDGSMIQRPCNCLIYLDAAASEYYIVSYLKDLISEHLEDMDSGMYTYMFHMLLYWEDENAPGRFWSEDQKEVVANILILCADKIDHDLREVNLAFGVEEVNEFAEDLRKAAVKWKDRDWRSPSLYP